MKITVSTYSDLSNYVKMFSEQELQLLVIASSAGQGKTTLVRNCIPDVTELSGRVSSAKLYDLLWENKDKLIFFDDIDDIYKDRQSVVMLKMLCQTEPIKTLSWQVRSRGIDRESPDSFQTSSRVILLTNKWERLTDHIGAVEDRGIILHFVPSPKEVHRYIAKNGGLIKMINNQVYEFIGEYHRFNKIPSIRHYLNCTIMALSGLDWKTAFLETIGIDKELSLVYDLSKSTLSVSEKISRFEQETGKNKRTYYRLLKQLNSEE